MMAGTNPPLSAGGPPSTAASARATQTLKRSVQAAFDGKTDASDACVNSLLLRCLRLLHYSVLVLQPSLLRNPWGKHVPFGARPSFTSHVHLSCHILVQSALTLVSKLCHRTVRSEEDAAFWLCQQSPCSRKIQGCRLHQQRNVWTSV